MRLFGIRTGRWIRWSIQGAGLALFAALFLTSPDAADLKEAPCWLSTEGFFLGLDPLLTTLVSIQASDFCHGTVIVLVVTVLVSLFFPRWFCSYLCPLGAVQDFLSTLLGWPFRHLLKKVKWVQAFPLGIRAIRFGVLAALLVAAVLHQAWIYGAVPMPMLTSGLSEWLHPGSAASSEGWSYVLVILGGVLMFNLFVPRFWCRVLCPSGALLSLLALLRLRGRIVASSCIRCNKCVTACRYDALPNGPFKTGIECASCEVCADVCPVNAIGTGWRNQQTAPLQTNHSEMPEKGALSRRAFLTGLGWMVLGTLITPFWLRRLGRTEEGKAMILHPPGALKGEKFAARCVSCAACIQVCPTGFLQPAPNSDVPPATGSPIGVPTIGPCAPDCNRCSRVCPTGAIVPWTATAGKPKIGLAQVDTDTCILCGECATTCKATGYNAIEWDKENPSYPIVDEKKCTGCGACENRCHRVNVLARRLDQSAIRVRPC